MVHPRLVSATPSLDPGDLGPFLVIFILTIISMGSIIIMTPDWFAASPSLEEEGGEDLGLG